MISVWRNNYISLPKNVWKSFQHSTIIHSFAIKSWIVGFISDFMCDSNSIPCFGNWEIHYSRLDHMNIGNLRKAGIGFPRKTNAGNVHPESFKTDGQLWNEAQLVCSCKHDQMICSYVNIILPLFIRMMFRFWDDLWIVVCKIVLSV